MSLRHAVLGLLAERPASGYDLMRLFETSLGNVWPATQSQVYGELGKLASSGLLAVSAQGPRGRKEYRITDEGLAELRHWLTETEPERLRRSEPLLRVFFLGVLTPVEASAYLALEATRAADAHSALEQLDAGLDWGEDGISVYGRLALEYGLRQTAMQEEWARWAAAQVEALPAAPADSDRTEESDRTDRTDRAEEIEGTG